ncbi:MAG: APC family permease [Candidatus Dormibacteraceae bacterium]
MADRATPLLRRAATFRHVYGQGLLSNAPLASTLVALTSAAAYALGATPLAYLIGLLVVVFWINTPYQFSRRMASASGMYYFVAKGVNTEAGYLAGIAYAAYYFFIVVANALFVGLLIQQALGLVGFNLPDWTWIPFLVASLIPVVVLTGLGIRLSLNYGIVTVVIEVVVLVAVSVVIIVAVGPRNTGAVYTTHYLKGGLSQLGIGILVAAFGMSGATATVYLGEEAAAPQRVIRRALVWATITVIALYILVSYAFTVGWGADRMGSFATSSAPGIILIQRYLGVAPMLVVALLALNSLVGVNVAATIVVSRLVYSFGRASLFPGCFAALSRWRTPLAAIVLTCGGALVIGLVLGIWLGAVTGYIFAIVVATMGEFIAHIVANLGLPFYYVREHALRWSVHLLLPALSIATILIGVYTTFVPVHFPTVIAPVIILGLLALGLIQVLLTRWIAPARAERTDRALAVIGSDMAAGAPPTSQD